MKLRFLPLLLLFIIPVSQAQTWVKVANEGDSVTLSSPITVQFGATVVTSATCNGGVRWIQAVYKLPATSPTVLLASPTFWVINGVFGKDPCPYITPKELDVLVTNVIQTVIVNGITKTIPAAPIVVVTPPPIPPVTIPTFATITCSFTVDAQGNYISGTCTTSAP
jgi:hypothetical protein